MSLILEALKKAERRHRLGEVPGIGSNPSLASRGQRRGLFLLLLFGVAAVMLLLGVYLGSVGLDPPRDAQPQSGAVLPPAESPPRERPSRTGPEMYVEPAGPTSELAKPVAAPPATTKTLPEAVAGVTRRAQAPPEHAPAEVEEVPEPPLQLSELPQGFLGNLPELNIDIHSFDERSIRRYVLINMQKYREGEYLVEGPLVSEIVPGGVILEYMGERFMLPIGNY